MLHVALTWVCKALSFLLGTDKLILTSADVLSKLDIGADDDDIVNEVRFQALEVDVASQLTLLTSFQSMRKEPKWLFVQTLGRSVSLTSPTTRSPG
jgi:hypothetical protein